jgi:hypothetical protein
MQITVVVSSCHALAGIPNPVCHEAVVAQEASKDSALTADWGNLPRSGTRRHIPR